MLVRGAYYVLLWGSHNHRYTAAATTAALVPRHLRTSMRAVRGTASTCSYGTTHSSARSQAAASTSDLYYFCLWS